MEDAVFAVGADGESLRFVLEGVGRGLGAFIFDGDDLAGDDGAL